MSSSAQPAISFQNVSKRFTYAREQPQSIQESLISVLGRGKRHPKKDLWAVQDLSFDLFPGQALGIIGRNGSGKSTVLKLIARIIRPTSGQVAVNGRVSALLELGAGFHPDLTGRENIALNSSLLGLTQEEVAGKFDEIVAFSELGEFIDMPVKHYSSGMYMRLGFSVAIHVDPDVLIIDEILAVGDQAFQAKCIDRIDSLHRQGVTIILISHDLQVVRRMCSSLIWLENGRMRASGPAEEVARDYRYQAEQAIVHQADKDEEPLPYRRWGNREIEITDVKILNSDNQEQARFQTGDEMIVEMAYEAHETLPEPEFGFAIFREDGQQINGPNSYHGGMRTGEISGSGKVRYCIKSLPLLPAHYEISAAIHTKHLTYAYDFHERAYSFRVVSGGTNETDGLVALPAEWVWTQNGEHFT